MRSRAYLTILMMVSLLPSCSQAATKPPGDIRPQWQVGDRWTVERPPGRSNSPSREKTSGPWWPGSLRLSRSKSSTAATVFVLMPRQKTVRKARCGSTASLWAFARCKRASWSGPNDVHHRKLRNTGWSSTTGFSPFPRCRWICRPFRPAKPRVWVVYLWKRCPAWLARRASAMSALQ